ncbi:hypothetical protein BKA82DRAFT_124699 [Pisolithus tinctorius]|uniref:Uncharacterized protein n=1 Tax=Pisolithus tinctorius Marx 270 TaxID=870435 RepID=A0A0C3PV36_PISTI|nr:hypothetical protein BKA82DRAFT_124699 [Pisolithus tinctorius]KIO12689.1 hypothetical protein M404DRAFT_124699 [Pisolithus tinctorius Marx 270]
MAYTTFAHTTTFLPTSPASPNAFTIFTHAQSPRENYALYEDVRQVFGNRNGRKQSAGGSSFKGLKKILGAI